MNEDIYLGYLQAKQPFGLNNLEALIHHGCRIYRDLGAHAPVGMPERLGSGYLAHLIKGHVPEGSTGGSKDHAL